MFDSTYTTFGVTGKLLSGCWKEPDPADRKLGSPTDRKGGSQMKIAILGAGGFVGSTLVAFLIGRDEHEICGVDKTGEKLAGITGPQFEFHKADITQNRDLVEDIVRRPWGNGGRPQLRAIAS